MNEREDKFLKALGNIDEKLIDGIVTRTDHTEGTFQRDGHLGIVEPKQGKPKKNGLRIAAVSGIAAALVITGLSVLAVHFSDIQTGSHGIDITLAPEVQSSALAEINKTTPVTETEETGTETSPSVSYSSQPKTTTQGASAPSANETDVEDTEETGGRGDMVDTEILVTPGTAAPSGTTDDTTVEPEQTTEITAAALTDDELKALVDGGMEGFGMAVSYSDLTRAGMKLHYVLDDHHPLSGNVYFNWGGRYELQRNAGDGNWSTYDPENVEKTGQWDVIYALGEFDESDNWIDEKVRFYGSGMYESEIPAGKYRIVKPLNVYSKQTGTHLGSLPFIVEFEITDETPTLFGITMTAKDVTPESVTLVVQQSGGNFHVKRKLGYEYPYYILRKTEAGEWEELLYNPTTWAPDIEPINENGTTEITVKFDRQYGSLPSGTYRISHRFVNYAVSSDGEQSVINRSTYFAEFEITDTAASVYDFGITLSAKNVTSEGLTLAIKQSGGKAAGTLRYDPYYTIEHLDTADKWEAVKELTREDSTDSIKIDVERESMSELKIAWKTRYGALPIGKYRIAVEFQDYRAYMDSDEQICYAEFEITDGEKAQWRVTMSVKDVTAEGLTLLISENGGIYPGDEVDYGVPYSVERQVGGEWETLPYVTNHDIAWVAIGCILRKNSTNEEQERWGYMYGALPAGHYRIKKDFTSGDYRTGAKYTCYAEFDISEEVGSRLGVTMRRDNNTNKRIEFAVTQSGGTVDGDIFITPAYWIERKNGDKWEELPTLSGEPAVWNAKEQVLERGSEITLGADFDMIYGELPEGEYRLAKTFFSGSITETVYANFTVTMNMTNAWGLGLKISSPTPEGGFLEISRSNEQTGNIIYKQDSYSLEMSDGNGGWIPLTRNEVIREGVRDVSIPRGMTTAEEIDWTMYYGTLAAGHYRFGMDFRYVTGDGSEIDTFYTEFDIK